MQIRSLSLAKSITTTVVTLTFISLPATAIPLQQTQPVPVQSLLNLTAYWIGIILFFAGLTLVIITLIFIMYKILKGIERLIFGKPKSEKKCQNIGYYDSLTSGDYDYNSYNYSTASNYANVENDVDFSYSASNNSSDYYESSNCSESSNSDSTDNNSWSSDNSSSSSYESSDYGGGCSSGDGGGDSW